MKRVLVGRIGAARPAPVGGKPSAEREARSEAEPSEERVAGLRPAGPASQDSVPPSTRIASPFTCAASSDARNATTEATVSGPRNARSGGMMR